MSRSQWSGVVEITTLLHPTEQNPDDGYTLAGFAQHRGYRRGNKNRKAKRFPMVGANIGRKIYLHTTKCLKTALELIKKHYGYTCYSQS